jgi:hypothetical protein
LQLSSKSNKLVGSESPSTSKKHKIHDLYMQLVNLDAKGIRETDSPGHGDDQFVLTT